MKKIILIFITFISFLVFHINFQEQGELERIKMDDPMSSLVEKNHQIIWSVPFNNHDSNMLIKDLINFANEYDVTLIANRMDQNNDLTDTYSYYIYSKEQNLFDDIIYLKENQKMRFIERSQYYTTNIADKNAAGYIDSLNPKYLKKYSNTYEFFPLSATFDKGEQPILVVHFIGDNKEELVKEIDQSNLAKYYNEYDHGYQYQFVEHPPQKEKLVHILLFVSIISVLLLFFCKITKETKEVITRKSYGMSVPYIFAKKYLLDLFWFIGVYLIVQVLCIYFIVGNPRPVIMGLINILFKYFLFYCAMIIILGVGIICIISLIKQVSHIKKRNSHEQICIINIVLKAIVITMIMSPLIDFTKTGIRQINSAIYINQQKEILPNLLFINGIKDNGSVLGSAIIKTKKIFNENGGWYQEWKEDETINHPYVVVNKNYINTYDLYTVEGKKIDIFKIKGDVLLVPEKYQHENLDYYGNENNLGYYDKEPVIIKNGLRIHSLNVVKAMYGFYGNDNPIIYVKDKLDSNCMWNYPFLTMPIKSEKTIELVEQYFKDEGISQTMLLNTSKTHYQVITEKVKDDLISALALLGIYLTIITTFLYENIYVYFIENKIKFAVRYLNGSSYWERHGDMMKLNIVVYMIPLLYGCFKLHIPLIEIFTFTIIAIMVELVSAYFVITNFEKNRIVEVLKGE